MSANIYCIVDDILQRILVGYCHDYRFLCGFVCKHWNNTMIDFQSESHDLPDSEKQRSSSDYNYGVIVPDYSSNDTIAPATTALMSIAKRGNIDVFRWLAAIGVLRNSPQVVMYVAEAAAEAGHLPLIQFCMSTWNIVPDDRVMVSAARGGHDDIFRFCYNCDGYSSLRLIMDYTARYGRDTMVRMYKEEWDVTASVTQIAESAAEGGHDSIIRLCHGWGAIDWGFVLVSAAKGGHLSSVRLCLEYETRIASYNYQNAICGAAKHGHMDVVVYLHEQMTRLNEYINLDAVIVEAAAGGQEAVIQLCIERWDVRAMDTLTAAVVSAAEKGNEHIVQMGHREWGIVDMDTIARAAAKGGHKAIVQWCLTNGAKNLHDIVRIALINAHFDIACLCKEEWNFDDHDHVIWVGANTGRIDIFHLGCEWGASDFNNAMAEAAYQGYENIMHHCRVYGADNYRECYELAKGRFEYDCMKLCKAWMEE